VAPACQGRRARLDQGPGWWKRLTRATWARAAPSGSLLMGPDPVAAATFRSERRASGEWVAALSETEVFGRENDPDASDERCRL